MTPSLDIERGHTRKVSGDHHLADGDGGILLARESEELGEPGNDDQNQEDIITKVEQDEIVKSGMVDALKTLKDRERFIIENRILADKPLTLEELGEKYNISRERVRQIENAALKKMKTVLKEKGISKNS